MVVQPHSSAINASPLVRRHLDRDKWLCFLQKQVCLDVPKPLKYLNPHLEVSTFFCVKKNHCCEQMVCADTCNLTTARHKLDMNSGNFLKEKTVEAA